MTLGDAAASLVGLRWGTHEYATWGHRRTWEGTAAMAVVTLLSVLVTLSFVPGSALSPDSTPWPVGQTLLVSVLGTLVATAAEALSPAGTDNLSVPLLSGMAMFAASSLL